MERSEKRSEGGDGGGHERILKGKLGDNGGNDAGDRRVVVLSRREVEEADCDDGDETAED